jgi:hypothetical protein
LLITEFGVPSSLGSAHLGTNGRDQGGHTEQQAMAIDANLLRLIKAQGVGAGFVFEWTDEWFKRTWNTEEHQLPGQLRRQLWHDALTNEQWFGAVATDSDRILYAAHDFSPPSGPLKVVHVDADATYVYLDVTAKGALPKRLVISANTVPGPQVADYRIDVDLARPNAQVYVRAALDPIRLDTSVPDYQPDVGKPWHRFRLIINRALTLHGKAYAPEFQDVGHLVEGSWDPSSPRFDSLSTWRRDGKTVRLRVPWGMLGMADPSSRLALGEGNPAKGVKIKGIGLTFDADGQRSTMTYSWPPWNYLLYTERPKAGIDVLAKALRQTAER